MTETSHQERCPESKIFRHQEEFQNCSHEAVTSVYQEAHEDSEAVTAKKLCKTLTVIANVCPQHLRECFETNDLLQMRSNHLHQMKNFLRRIFSKSILNMNFLENCDLETGQVNSNDLPTPETTETDLVLDMTTEENGKNDLKNFISNSITENNLGVDEGEDVTTARLDIFSLTGEIDRNAPVEGEEDPVFSNIQKVILDYELNGSQDKIPPSQSDKTRYEDHFDSDKSSPELDKNHSSNSSSNLNLLIYLILHSVFLLFCRTRDLSSS